MSTSSPSRLFALVPCAGVGERAAANGPKQYAALAGASVVSHTLAALAKLDAGEVPNRVISSAKQGLAETFYGIAVGT
jgi:2-C-methyl-D-erythritol 4-phosphate cytidylyltransferase